MMLGKQERVLFVHKKEETLMLAQIAPSQNSQRTYINIYRLNYDTWKWAFIRQLNIDQRDAIKHKQKIIVVIGWAVFNNIINSDKISKSIYESLYYDYRKEMLSGEIEDNSWHPKEWLAPKKVRKRWKKQASEI